MKGLITLTIQGVLLAASICCSIGAGAQSKVVKDIWGKAGSDTPEYPVMANNHIVFFGEDSATGYELWRTDGTAAGTTIIADLSAGALSTDFGEVYHYNGITYFSGKSRPNTIGDELWKTDGTAAGTIMLKDIYPGNIGSDPYSFYAYNNKVYFCAEDDLHGYELWVTDGTTAGTVMIKDINPGTGQSNASGFCEYNGSLYFMAQDGTNGYELWKSDGTANGTVMVKDIYAFGADALPRELTVCNGMLFFYAYSPDGSELWKSDGTAAGTVLVKDIHPGSNSSAPSRLTAANNTLYFSAGDGTNGYELWKSDGTAGGTVMVKDINPGLADGIEPYYMNMIAYKNELFFVGKTSAEGNELWKTDGSAAGTVLVKDILPGAINSYVRNFAIIAGDLYFSALTLTEGMEVWKTDGTTAGTVLYEDVHAGSDNSSPSGFLPINGKMLFIAEDAAVDREWRYVCLPINDTVQYSSTTHILTASASGASYQWINCSTNTPIAGATNKTYTATANGQYKVAISYGSGDCTDTSACITVSDIVVGVHDIHVFDNVTIAPNPSTGRFTITTGILFENLDIKVTDITGKTIKYSTVNNAGQMMIDGSNWHSGMYFIQLQSGTASRTFKLIKE